MSVDAELAHPLVVGMGVTGAAVVEALLERGHAVVVAEDHPTDDQRRRADSLGVSLVTPAAHEWDDLVRSASVVLPSPGIPDRHPVFAAATSRAVPVRSEFDLARRWDDRPLVAITGTNGKTTVTEWVTAMLEASGRRAAAVGNTETPLVAALDDADIEVFVVEASSFRLGHTDRIEPLVAVWLNVAPDHLDAHSTYHAYVAAKARIWANLRPGGVCVAPADDPEILATLPPGATVWTFGTGPAVGLPHATVVDGVLRGTGGEELVEVSELRRSLPHDIENALAASCAALAAGADLAGIQAALRSFAHLPHRVELVADVGGVRWVNDAKSTSPDATLAAVAGFESVVLIAGGRNKGLDLTSLGASVPPVVAVVAIGEAAGEVASVFAGKCPVRTAETMADAVAAAASLANSGDTVVLSPACASFDWYRNYVERGQDFVRIVRAHVDAPIEPGQPR